MYETVDLLFKDSKIIHPVAVRMSPDGHPIHIDMETKARTYSGKNTNQYHTSTKLITGIYTLSYLISDNLDSYLDKVLLSLMCFITKLIRVLLFFFLYKV